MSSMIPFEYSGFHDVPLGLFVRDRGTTLLLLRTFNDESDDYSDAYSVYRMPNDIEIERVEVGWEVVAKSRGKLLGTLPVHAVKFDTTKRRSLEASAIEPFIAD